jgi:hypothetical protein
MAKNNVTQSTHPLPELFWSDDVEDEPQPMSAPIATVRVYRYGTNGEKELIDTTTLDALPNRNAFRDAYGPALFEVHGRAASGSIVAKATFRIAMPPGRVWRPPSPQTDTSSADASPAPALVAAPGADPMTLLVQEMLRNARTNGQDPTVTLLLTHVLSLSKEMATISAQGNERIIEAISHLSGARLQDQQDLFKTIMNMKAATGGTDPVKAFKDGMQQVIDLVNEGKAAEEAGGGEVSAEALVKSFLDAIGAQKKADNVVPMQGGNRAAS